MEKMEIILFERHYVSNRQEKQNNIHKGINPLRSTL